MRTVTAGVNVVGIREGGQVNCVIDCRHSPSACATASVVYVSPNRYDVAYVCVCVRVCLCVCVSLSLCEYLCV